MQIEMHRESLKEVEQDIAAIYERLEQLKAVAAYHSSKLGIPAQNDTANANSNGHSLPRPKTWGPNRFRGASQRDAALAIIKEAGRPLRAAQIAATMVEHGYPAPKKMGMLNNSLFTSMTRDEGRFVKVGPGLWGARENTQEEPGR